MGLEQGDGREEGVVGPGLAEEQEVRGELETRVCLVQTGRLKGEVRAGSTVGRRKVSVSGADRG